MKKTLLLVAGWLSLITGLIGVVVPLLPTTPFMLMSAYCFAHSSKRLHDWITGHPRFGPSIRQWQHNRTVNPSTKTKALFLILISFTITLTLTPLPWYGMAALILLALILMGFVARLPEATQNDGVKRLKAHRGMPPHEEKV
jgi:hypothetical protein